MTSKTGTIPKAKVGTGATISKTTSKVAPNINFDAATQAFLNSSYGTEAAWYNDPNIGPVLKSALTAGKGGTALQGQQYQDYIRTHAVVNGKVAKVAPEKSWYGTHGAAVRQAFGQKLSDPGTYNANVATILNDQIIPLDKQLGTALDQNSLQTIAESAYTNGWGGSSNLITQALLAQKQKNTTPLTPPDPNAVPAGGQIGETLNGTGPKSFAVIAANYGIPVPKDPAQMQDFVNSAVGPGGSTEAFTEYAKNQAKIMYPFMSAALDAGATVKGYFAPYTTQIANTLDLSPDQINWQDPKWQSLIAKPDPAKPGLTQPQTMSDIMRQIKTDPQYGYDNTQAGIADANNFGENLKSMFGF